MKSCNKFSADYLLLYLGYIQIDKYYYVSKNKGIIHCRYKKRGTKK